MIQTFLAGAVSGSIVVATGWIVVGLYRAFPHPERYDWPVWAYRMALTFKVRQVVHPWREHI